MFVVYVSVSVALPRAEEQAALVLEVRSGKAARTTESGCEGERECERGVSERG